MPLRVGVVGVGWGARVHVPAFRAVPDFELVALCGRRAERLERAAQAAGVTDTSTDWESFVRRDDLDVISIATPADLHHPIGMAAIGAGKHVLCEKPLAGNDSESRELVDAAAAAGVANAVAFELRWLPDKLAVWQAVQDGAVGQLYFLRLSGGSGYWHPTHRPQEAWMYSLTEGGGFLNGSVSHDIDYLMAVAGQPVAVCAEVRNHISTVRLADDSLVDVTADDTSVLMFRMASGATAVLTFCAVGMMAGGFEFEAFGRAGSLFASTAGSSRLRGPRKDEMWVAREGAASLERLQPASRRPRCDPDLEDGRFTTTAIRALAMFLEDWLPTFSGGRSLVPTFHDGFRVQTVIDAARRSTAIGGWVDIPECVEANTAGVQ